MYNVFRRVVRYAAVRVLVTVLLLVTAAAVHTHLSPDIPETGTAEPPCHADVELKYVVDGDTIRVVHEGNDEYVRLLGIDTPELGENDPERWYGIHDPAWLSYHGELSTEYVRGLIAPGDTVRLVFDGSTDDRCYHGRLLAYVEVNGTDVGALLIENGLAMHFGIRRFQREELYASLEDAAREKGVGIWSEGLDR